MIKLMADKIADKVYEEQAKIIVNDDLTEKEKKVKLERVDCLGDLAGVGVGGLVAFVSLFCGIVIHHGVKELKIRKSED